MFSENERAFLFENIRRRIMYKKVDTAMNFVDREKEVIGFWKAA